MSSISRLKAPGKLTFFMNPKKVTCKCSREARFLLDRTIATSEGPSQRLYRRLSLSPLVESDKLGLCHNVPFHCLFKIGLSGGCAEV